MMERNRITLSIPGEVVPQARPRAYARYGKACVYERQECADFKEKVRKCARTVWKEVEDASSRFSVRMVFGLRLPTSVSARKRAQMVSGEFRPSRKPDLDNAAKGVMDGLTGIVWKDDGQVVELLLEKYYMEQPETLVVVSRLPEGGARTAMTEED